MNEDSQPITRDIEIDGITYHGSEDWGDDGLVCVTFTDGDFTIKSDLFEPADLPHAWGQAEHRIKFNALNRASQSAMEGVL